MAPPSYNDLGKPAKDLFGKGYNFGFLKLESTIKPSDVFEFKTASSHNVGSGKMFGSLDLKYKVPKYGVTLTEKWNTDNTLSTEIQAVDQVAKGTKLTLDSSFAPNSGKRTAKVKGEFTQDNLKLNTDVGLNAGPVVNASAVFAWEGWLLGLSSGFDTKTNKPTSNNVALGRAYGSYNLHTYVNDASVFGGSMYHKVNDKLEIAAQGSWKMGEQNTSFGVACLYKADKDWKVRAKLDNKSQLALSTQHALNNHLSLTMSALFNVPNFSEGGHKFGVGLEYTPCC